MCGLNICSYVIFAILLARSCDFQSLSWNSTFDASKCTQFKKLVFEEVTTFGFLMHGVKGVEVVTDTCTTFEPFIVNGIPAKPKEFPHIARLGNWNSTREEQERLKWFCGGTLISEKYVLTAAHCFYGTQGVVNRVRLGELDFSTNQDDAQPENFKVQRYIPHPQYEWRTPSIYNDIGLVELDRSVTLNHYKHPACLPNPDSAEIFDTYIAIGWGSTKFTAPDSTVLLKVKLQRFSYDRCAEHTNYRGNDMLEYGLDDRSQFCAGSSDSRDTCTGDSGGPLLVYHPDYPCMYIVVGITSNGFAGCGSPNVPGIYTKVSKYLDWIGSIVW